ncbi:hypothetical protein CSA_004465, partial [Cucumis sativus]
SQKTLNKNFRWQHIRFCHFGRGCNFSNLTLESLRRRTLRLPSLFFSFAAASSSNNPLLQSPCLSLTMVMVEQIFPKTTPPYKS